MTMTLYEIALEYRALAERLAATNDDEQSVADTLEGEAYPLEVKVTSCAYAAKNLAATAEAIKAAAKDMMARAERLERQQERLKKYMADCMEIAGVKAISCPHFEVRLQANPEKVDVFEEALVPNKFYKQPPPVLDKAALKDALKKGDVPGAKLTRTQRLSIK